MTEECKDPRGWAIIPVGEVKIGDVLIADGGFTCIDEGQECMVRARTDHSGRRRLFVKCRQWSHGLDGQLDDAGENYVGFWKKDKGAS